MTTFCSSVRARLSTSLVLLLTVATTACQGQAPAARPLPDLADAHELAAVTGQGKVVAFGPLAAPVVLDAGPVPTTVADLTVPDRPLRRPDPAIPPVSAADTLAPERSAATGSVTTEEPLSQVAASLDRPKPLGEPVPAATVEEEILSGEELLDEGVASTYGTGDGFQGNLTACGQVFDTYVPQVAHKTLPCGTLLRVEDVATGRSVTVPVTDRGPYIPGRVVDLSWAAFRQLDGSGPGLLDVRVYRVS